MSLAVGLEQELGDEFGGDFDEFDEFGGHFLVCLREKAGRLMSLGVRLEEELGDEFGGDFDEFDEFGRHFLVRLREKGVRLMSLGVRLMSLVMALETELVSFFGGLMSLGVG